jgi:hypothetical protein
LLVLTYLILYDAILDLFLLFIWDDLAAAGHHRVQHLLSPFNYDLLDVALYLCGK